MRFFDDFALNPIGTIWSDTGVGGFVGDERFYVVQTDTRVISRCLLATTDPGDLVLDPTCGSGTTAYVAEQWGRRWITIDTSRVPLALARQRLLTATFDWYELQDEHRGPAAGFTYKRKQNNKGEEVGGIVPHVTLKSIANNEPPEEEVLVDRPEIKSGITRVTGPFCFEGTIPAAVQNQQQNQKQNQQQNQSQEQLQQQRQTQGPSPSASPAAQDDIPLASAQDDIHDNLKGYVDRMLEVLRRAPVLRMAGNKTITLKNVRPPAKSLSLSAEAVIPNGSDRTVALVLGPENGAVSERLVFDAAKEATAKNYSHLFVVGFKIEPNARLLVDKCNEVVGIPATYVEATMDLQMGDLLKNMRSSQIFSVCGLPDVTLRKAGKSSAGDPQYTVELHGVDVFDPASMEVISRHGDEVPAWFVDTNYNGLSFHVDQAFFPRTGAWENLKKALKGEYEDSVWEHLAGATSAPFAPGDNKQIAVKVIDDRGNELMVVKSVGEAK